jgi:IMP cyclohydrolase
MCRGSKSTVNLIRIQSGINVLPHYDSTRNYAINIGLKNSNSCVTYITTDRSTDAYWDKPQYSYITSDGDVYLVAVKNAHAVKTLVEKKDNSNRYLMTYNIHDRYL